MKNRQGEHLWQHGLFSGWTEYRYGASKPSGQPEPILTGQKRQKAISLTVSVLRDWRLSPFEHEGTARAGLRSAFCLQGYDWRRSDAEAASIVAEGQRRLRAVRPSWEEGQHRYTVGRENCLRCGVALPEEMLNVGARFCCQECARFAITYWDFEERTNQDAAYRSAQDVIQRSKHHTRSCEHCGKPFLPMFGHNRFCSRECANAAAIVLKPKDCLNCGKTFQPRNRYSLYCSFECAGEARISAPERQCAHCGKTFRRAIGNAKGRGIYCSKACAYAARGKVEVMKTCECCGTPFIANGAKALYCSTTCAQIVSKLKHGRRIARISPPVLDYLFRRQGLRITSEVRLAA